MSRCFLALWLGFLAITPPCVAADCTRLAQAAERQGEIVPDAGSGRAITGKGRLPLYAAPDAHCRIAGLFLVPGDTLFAQRRHKGFTQVAFVPMRKTDRQDVVAWVPSGRLRANGQGIVPGRFTGER